MAAPHSPEPPAARLPRPDGELGPAAGVAPLPQAATPAAAAAASAAAGTAEARRAARHLLPGDVRGRDTGMSFLRPDWPYWVLDAGPPCPVPPAVPAGWGSARLARYVPVCGR